MGKRSDFDRLERDFYPTPMEAVAPLLRVIGGTMAFAEPCAGDGRLIDHIESEGHMCNFSSDIDPQSNGIERKSFELLSEDDVKFCDFIITNPPWDRKILHPMIEKFSSLRPTWLLFDADWMHTKQAAPYLKWCRAVVSVGRVKWIPDSKMTGKDNCCWYLFDQESNGEVIFTGRYL